MTPSRHSAFAAVALTAVAALAACSGTSTPKASTTSTSAKTTPATPSTTPSTTTSSAAVAAPRTAAELKKALMELSDLPSGFAVEPDSSNSGNPQVTSKNSKCAPFVHLSNLTAAPGSKASAHISFSAGQSGPFIDESLDALGGDAAVSALQATLKSAVSACNQVTLTVPGAGTSTVTVRTVNPPKYGTDPLAVRLTASGGPLNGMEITMVTTGVADTVLSLNFIAATADDIDGATSVSVDKATATLGSASTATS